MKLDLLNRVLTAAALVALAVTLGVWLTRAPLTAAPATTPVKIAPEPILAPPPPAPPTVTPTIIEVPVEVEIAAEADEPPAAKPTKEKLAEPTPKSKAACQPGRRGLFRRR
jgi:hypothetical protein